MPTPTDFKMLALEHGRDNVTNSAFFGSDFFLESQEELFNLLEKLTIEDFFLSHLAFKSFSDISSII